MTDRERLLEQVREAESAAKKQGLLASVWSSFRGICHSEDVLADGAYNFARAAAHHALTAMALRDAIEEQHIYREQFDVPQDWTYPG